MGRAGAADAVAVTAGGVVAPAAHVTLGAIHKDPKTTRIGAELQAIVRFLRQGFGEGCGDAGERGGPANLHRVAFEVQPILVLHQLAKDGYFEPRVEDLHVFRFDGLAGGSLLEQVAQEFAKLAEFANFRRAGRRRGEAPEGEEIANPLGIVEKVGEVAVAVPHFAVGKVDPGGSRAEVMDAKGMGRRDHGNEIKLLDSLQG